MALNTPSIGSIRRLLSLHSRSQIKELLIDAGANRDRILPIPIVNDMKSKDYRSKAEVLSLMFDPLYEDFDSHGAESVLLNLVKLMFNNNTDFSPARLDVMTEVRNKLRADGIDFDKVITTGVTKTIIKEEISTVAHSYKYDVFICHASEDKDSFVRSFATALHDKGLQVWYDEFSLTVGDSLRRSIDYGLSQSRFGIVILSKSFFAKEWPQRELDGLTAREVNGVKVILPVWHDVSREEVLKYSPVLADRVGVQTSRGLDHVVSELMRVINFKDQNSNVHKNHLPEVEEITEPNISFPDILPSSIKESKFRILEAGGLKSKEDMNELIKLLFEEPECTFYYFSEKDSSKADSLLIDAKARGDILMNKSEFFYYKHPSHGRDFLKIEVRDGNYQWAWQKEVVEKGPMFVRRELKLSHRKRTELEALQKIAMEENIRSQQTMQADDKSETKANDSNKIPEGLWQAIFHLIGPLNTRWKKTILGIVILIVICFSVWATLPEKYKTDFIDFLKVKISNDMERTTPSSMESEDTSGHITLHSGETVRFTKIVTSGTHDRGNPFDIYSNPTPDSSIKPVDIGLIEKIIFGEKKETVYGSYILINISYKNGSTDKGYVGLNDIIEIYLSDNSKTQKLNFYKIKQITFN